MRRFITTIILFSILLILKLTIFTNWSWLLVTSPLWIVYGISLILGILIITSITLSFLGALILGFFLTLFGKD